MEKSDQKFTLLTRVGAEPETVWAVGGEISDGCQRVAEQGLLVVTRWGVSVTHTSVSFPHQDGLLVFAQELQLSRIFPSLAPIHRAPHSF